VRSRLKALMLDGKYAELLEAGEEVMAQPYGRGWLDLQRYILDACDGLGPQYEAVASAIKGALRTLLRDLPELLDLTLMDDTPTANAQTRAWLAQRGLIGGEAEVEAPAAEAPSMSRGEAVLRAEALLRSGDSQRAIQLLLRAADQEKSARARFLGKSQAARVMVESGFDAVALPILREMAQQIEKHGLEDWEAGDTVAQPLGLLYRCLAKLGTAEQEKQPLYLRICRLDPLQAMQLASSTAPNAGT
jgi:type VI secretion system protein ImpA